MKYLLFFSLTTLFLRFESTAQWVNDPDNPKRVSTSATDQRKPILLDDDNGGMYVFWRTYEPSVNFFRVHAQHINANGVHLLGDTGKLVLYRQGRNINDFGVAKAPNGEMMMVWMEGESVFMDSILCRRLQPGSLAPIGAGPKKIAGKSAAFGILGFDVLQVIQNGTHFFVGYQVVFFGGAGGTYIQKTDLQGNPLLTQNGNSGQQMTGCTQCYGPFSIIKGPMGGVHLIQRSGNGAGAQLAAYRMNGDGTIVFAYKPLTDGTPGLAYTFDCLPDGVGGFVFSWVQVGGDVKISRADSLGNLAWTPNHISVSSFVSAKDMPQVCKEGADFYVAFLDSRGEFSNSYTYLQKISAQGSTLWHPHGRRVFPGGGLFGPNTKLIPMGDGSVVVAAGKGGAFLGQKVLADSILAWQPEGSTISTTAHWPFYENYQMVRGSQGNVLLAWQGDNPNNRIFVTNLGADGTLVEVKKPINQSDLRVWPNPFTDRLFVQNEAATQMELFTATGQKIKVSVETQPEGHSLQVSQLKPGVYFLRMEQPNGSRKTEIVVKEK